MESSDIFERMHRITQPIDYEDILRSGVKYEDSDFPPDNSSLFSISVLWDDEEEEDNDVYDEEIETDQIGETELDEESSKDPTEETTKEPAKEVAKEPIKVLLQRTLVLFKLYNLYINLLQYLLKILYLQLLILYNTNKLIWSNPKEKYENCLF